ncbi:Atr, partial [Symbiodinium microadriaticum]
NVPCLHRWFLNAYTDPTEWLDARTTFTRSCAVWSAVGHVMGLGDRHGENILLDTENAECMHVDFDCLFDKGLSLARPEIVPFRLTPNMVDAMGPTGVEGCFRRSMEVCLGLL